MFQIIDSHKLNILLVNWSHSWATKLSFEIMQGCRRVLSKICFCFTAVRVKLCKSLLNQRKQVLVGKWKQSSHALRMIHLAVNTFVYFCRWNTHLWSIGTYTQNLTEKPTSLIIFLGSMQSDDLTCWYAILFAFTCLFIAMGTCNRLHRSCLYF